MYLLHEALIVKTQSTDCTRNIEKERQEEELCEDGLMMVQRCANVVHVGTTLNHHYASFISVWEDLAEFWVAGGDTVAHSNLSGRHLRVMCSQIMMVYIRLRHVHHHIPGYHHLFRL